MSAEKKITVTQTRSGIARIPQFKDTLKALGLGRIGKQSTLPANPAVLGMIRKVAAVIKVENA